MMRRNLASPLSLALTLPLAMTMALAPGAAEARPDAERLASLVVEAAPEAIALRHHLHRHPELSNREVETAARLAEWLEELGMEVTTGIAHTGVVGVLRGGRPGPVVAVRADMDALPVTEETDFPFRSTVRTTFQEQEVGVSHACGHDIHMAVAAGLAAVLGGLREELPGTVLFVFQPAEEGAPAGEEGGAELMLREGVFDPLRPEAIFALHSWPDLEVGQVAVAAGPTMAAVDRFHVRLRGEQSHGASPHLGVDPVVMASQAVLALQTIRSRTMDPGEPGLVSVGIFRAGERFNIIPAEAYLEGTVRSYEGAVQDTIERRMHEILGGVAAAAGGSYELDYVRVTPATVNDPELHQRVEASLVRALGAEQVLPAAPTMAGEDFAFFAQEVPGYYFRLGVREPGGVSGGLHTPTLRAVDEAVPVGMRAMAQIVLDALEHGQP